MHPACFGSRTSTLLWTWKGWSCAGSSQSAGKLDGASQQLAQQESHHSGLTKNSDCPQMLTFLRATSLRTMQPICIQQSADHSAMRMALQMLGKHAEKWHSISGRHLNKSREENT